MDNNDLGRVPSEPGAIASGDGAASVSAHTGHAPSRVFAASVAEAHRRLQYLENARLEGPPRTFPDNYNLKMIEEYALRAVMETIQLAKTRGEEIVRDLKASGIAARSDETRSGSAEGKSPVA